MTVVPPEKEIMFLPSVDDVRKQEDQRHGLGANAPGADSTDVWRGAGRYNSADDMRAPCRVGDSRGVVGSRPKNGTVHS
eukprot:832673-Pyramimonas_sp.AAC.1